MMVSEADRLCQDVSSLDWAGGRATRTLRQLDSARLRDATVLVCDAHDEPLAGMCVSAEQLSHEFPFGCVLHGGIEFSETERERYHARVAEVFNVTLSADWQEAAGAAPVVDVSGTAIHLGRLRSHLDRLTSAGGVWLVLSGRTASSAVDVGGGHGATSHEHGVACRIAELFTLSFSHPVVTGIVWQGFCEREPEVLPGHGLIRPDLAPRHAHRLLRKLTGTAWHTRATGTTATDGCFTFRGFAGVYRLVVSPSPGAPAVAIATASLRGDGPAPQRFRVRIPDR